jgi:tetratricopeptide (TPR) repeat protein
MDSTTPGPLKPRLLALMAAGQAQQQAFIAQLGAAERAAQGAPAAWAAKDHLAHLAAWRADAARVIAATARGEIPAPSPDETEFNPRVFAAQQHQSWEAILADLAAADAALSAALEACSEADLSDPARFPWREGSPLWYKAFVSGYDHPVEHFQQFYLEAGDVARAGAVYQEAVETARRLIGETDPYGWMVYKLGCFYASIDQPDRALPLLREGLAREPRLREWMAEDSALAALHADPAFQALLAEAAGAAPD